METREIILPDAARTVIECFGWANPRAQGLIAFLPALGVAIDYYRPLAEAWARRGYRVATLEMRGMKQSSVRDVKRENFGYKEVLTTDLPAFIGHIKREAVDLPLYLVGHSLGGQFALLHASRYREGVAGVAILAGGSNYYGAMPRGVVRHRRHVEIRLARLINAALGYFPGHRLGFAGRQPRNLIADWSHEGLTGAYAIIDDDTDYNAALATVSLPVLMVSLSGDPLVPLPCADFLAAKLHHAEISQVELSAQQLGMPAAHHFRWVQQPEAVLDQFERWVRGRRQFDHSYP